MPKLDGDALAALEALRDQVPAQAPPSECWVGGRLFRSAEGEVLFLPLGTPRRKLGRRRLTFLGDGVQNSKGWFGETSLTNPAG